MFDSSDQALVRLDRHVAANSKVQPSECNLLELVNPIRQSTHFELCLKREKMEIRSKSSALSNLHVISQLFMNFITIFVYFSLT